MKRKSYFIQILLNRLKCRNKGSVLIFICIIMLTMFSMVMVFIDQSKKIGQISYIDAVVNLSGRSVLSEFNTELKDNYGLLAFSCFPSEINDKVEKYINYSFRKKENIKVKSISTDNKQYNLQNPDVFEKEVVEYTKYAICKDIFKDEDDSKVEGENRELKNKKIIDSLPSKYVNGDKGVVKNIVKNKGRINNVFDGTTERIMLNQYILAKYNSKIDTNNNNTFFKNEAEYVICGKLSDQSNYNSYKRKLVVLRNIMNGLYIGTNTKMQGELTAAAGILTPGPEAVVTKVVLAEAWALAEAYNDVKLLEKGENVSFIKNSDSWALDLETVIKNTNDSCIKPKSDLGLNYKEYMQIFLFFMDRETKLGRMMDIIQINIQGNSDETFLMNNANIGFDIRCKVNGEYYVYTQKY